MNFLSNVLDSIPVVGHVKSGVHYLAGDEEGAKKALHQSTRTSAVLAGGAVGCLAGPAGAVAGAMYAGLVTDVGASIVTGESQGVVESCENIGEDIRAGRNPTGSIVSATVQVGFDGLGGLGMGGLSSAASNISEKAVAKTVENVGKKVINVIGEEVIEKTVKISAEEAAKVVTKKVSEQAVKKAVAAAVVRTEIALVTTHISYKAGKRTEKEEEQRKKDREEREKRRRDAEREERAREERERREREERERREREDRERSESERNTREEQGDTKKTNNKNKKSTSTTNSGNSGNQQTNSKQGDAKKPSNNNKKCTNSGNQPPQKNNNNQNQSTELDVLETFMNLLKILLTLIYKDEKEPFTHIFKNLTQGQKDYLIKTIEILRKNGMLDEVIEIVLRIFKNHLPNNISFNNFLSLLEFVQAYINEELNIRILKSRGTIATKPKVKYQERRKKIIIDIANQKDIIKNIIELFKKLKVEIESETTKPNNIIPNFRDIFSAISHYFKHKNVPGDGTLSVKDYYYWIRKMLEKLKKTAEYAKLPKSKETITYEMFVTIFNRRFRIVVRVFNGKIVLSSAFVVCIIIKGDKDGDIFIDISKPAYRDN